MPQDGEGFQRLSTCGVVDMRLPSSDQSLARSEVLHLPPFGWSEVLALNGLVLVLQPSPLEPNTEVLVHPHWHTELVVIELHGTTTMGSISFVRTFSNSTFSSRLGFSQRIDDTSSKFSSAPIRELHTSLKRLRESVVCIRWPVVVVCSSANRGS